MKAVLVVDVQEAKRIVAPSSWLFPDKPTDLVRKQVLSRYGVEELSVEKMRRQSP
jgi:hypothetical protein